MRTKKRKATTSTPSPPPPRTTIDSLPDDVVSDILLRLPSTASIARAMLASVRWCRVASSPTFIRRLRDLHSYPLLLGHFVSLDDSAVAQFRPVPLHSDRVLAAMVRRGDFFLTRVQVKGSSQRVLEDCRDGLLLFSGMRTLRIFDPLHHRVISLRRPPSHGALTHGYVAHTFCLLPDSNEVGTFRVISLQNRNKSSRFEVYDSRTRDWHVHPAGTAKTPARSHLNRYFPAMHAAGRIYWKYAGEDLLLSFDTEAMQFSYVGLPPGVSCRSAYAVGETEDGTCCLLHVLKGSNGRARMQVWFCKDDEDNGDWLWELEREVPLRLSSTARGNVHQVRSVVAGIVLVCLSSSSAYLPHVAFRLKNLKVEAEFTCRGLARPFVLD